MARNKFSYNEGEIAVSTRTYRNEYTHLQKRVRVLTEMSTRTYFREYVVLIYDTSLINYFFVLIGGDNVDKPRRGGTIYLA